MQLGFIRLTFFLAIFLAFGKRYSEYNFEEYIKIRHSKSQYDVKLIKDFIIISCMEAFYLNKSSVVESMTDSGRLFHILIADGK